MFTTKEQRRLQVLESLNLMDTESEESFDRITKLVSDTFAVPISLITLIDEDKQFFKSCIGLDLRSTPRELAFCNKVVDHEDAFIIEDTLEHPEFRHHPFVVNDPKIRFYAGAPLVIDGYTMGSLCLIDTKPKRFTTEMMDLLKNYAKFVKTEIEYKREDAELKKLEDKQREDIDIAAQIQKSVLPTRLNENDISIQGFHRASHNLSGDMYFWTPINKHCYGGILLDVMGHGISSSLISMAMRSIVNTIINTCVEPVYVIERLNEELNNIFTRDNGNKPYATCIYFLVNTKEKTLEFVNAGHPPAIYIGKDTQFVESSTIPIGLYNSLPHIKKQTINYSEGSELLMFTDGLQDINSKYHIRNIKEYFNKNNFSNKMIFNEIKNEIKQQDELEDDICLVSLNLR